MRIIKPVYICSRESVPPKFDWVLAGIHGPPEHFIFKRKLSFLLKITKIITRVISGFSRIHPIYDFRDFLKMVISTMTFYFKNLKNHLEGEYVQIQEYDLIILFVIFLKNDSLGMKMKVLKISRNSA